MDEHDIANSPAGKAIALAIEGLGDALMEGGEREKELEAEVTRLRGLLDEAQYTLNLCKNLTQAPGSPMLTRIRVTMEAIEAGIPMEAE